MIISKVNTEVYFEDAQIGFELPLIVKNITLQQMAMYAAVCWDFSPIHYDSGTAQSMGIRTAFAEGPMETAFLCQLLTNWMGVTGILKKISVTYRGMVFPGDTLTCQGKITNKYREGDENFVELELKAINQEGQRTICGTAVATLPSRE